MTSNERTARILKIKASAPRSVTFLGYGGSDPVYETLVYSDPQFGEVRFPVDPDLFPIEDVESEYICIAALDWDDFYDQVDEYENSFH